MYENNINIINAVHVTYLSITKKSNKKKGELQLKHLNAYMQVLYMMLKVHITLCTDSLNYRKFISNGIIESYRNVPIPSIVSGTN